MIEEPSDECRRQDERLNAVLDGDRPADDLQTDHASSCARCKAFAALVPALALPAIFPPAAVEPVWVRSIVAERSGRPARSRRLQSAVAVLAASVVLVLGKVGTRAPQVTRPEIAAAVPTNHKIPVTEAMDSRTALARLTTGLSERVSAATPNLNLPTILPFTPNEPNVSPSSGDALAAVPDSARAGLEPIAGTTRRAYQLFLRELPTLPRDAATP